jgi:hypothetical protein
MLNRGAEANCRPAQWAENEPGRMRVRMIGTKTLGRLSFVALLVTVAGLTSECASRVARSLTAPNDPPADTLPTIALSPQTLTFTATAGASSPAPQAVMVSDSGTEALTGLAIGPMAYGPGASGWLAASVSPATAPATVTITPTLGTIPAGTYTATVWILSSAPGVTNSPQTMGISLIVNP